ncbi:MAG: hypothetical protein JWM49_626 [Microbacteriaceae bacterium]|nr:hypothetical protein [Microbacteriaceae bacterium]
MNRLFPAVVAAAVALAVLLTGCTAAAPSNLHATVTPAKAVSCPTVVATTAALSVLTSSSVIGSLVAAPTSITPWTSTFQISGGRVTIYEKSATGNELTPSGALARSTPWETIPQPVVVIGEDRCGFDKILLPARQRTPSPGSPAPAQTAGWVRTSDLVPLHATPDHVLVDLSAHSLAIIDTGSNRVAHTWPIVQGAVDSSPTPVGIGYLESEYVDPRQTETANTTITLTSFHSQTTSFNGNAGELGLHFFANEPANAASHGCLRLPSSSAAEVVGALPTGTPILIRN